VHGSRNVEMKGKSVIYSGAYIRGDFSPVRIGRYCQIGEGSIIRPCHVQPKNEVIFSSLKIGNHTRIGSACVIEAAAIGASVFIGDGCVLSKRVIVKDCCWIEPNTVLSQDTVIPPFSIVGGCPGRIIGELPESASVDLVDECVNAFAEFVKNHDNLT